jgi:hypothetical protein
LHDIPEHIQTSLRVGPVEEVTFVELSAEGFVHRDSVRFGNGRQVLLQHLHVGQQVNVLSLSSAADDRERSQGSTQETESARFYLVN